MTADTYAHEGAHLTIGLEREPQDQETLPDFTREALAAMEALCTGWLKPLVWELSVACCDTEIFYTDQSCQPPRPDWVLLEEQIPNGVQARLLHVEPVICTVPTFDSECTRAWIAEALDQKCPGAPRFVTSWSRLWSRAVQAELPDPQRFVDREDLRVDCYAGVLPVPLDRRDGKIYVSGPLEDYVFGPPAALTLGNDDGFLTIGLEIYWRLWINEPAGRAQVEAAVERVLALDRGWRRSEG